jgi:hypothetical protein
MIQRLVIAIVVTTGIVAAQEKAPEFLKPGAEHKFLEQFVGEWDCEFEAIVEPGKPPVKSKSQMTGRMVGGFWSIVEVKGDFLGLPYHGQGTFGFDSKKKKYVGTWADSMSEFFWKYEGTAEGGKLALHSEGPNPEKFDQMLKTRDTWEFNGKDTVVLTGEVAGPDGKLMPMMKATCTRKKP